MNDKQLAEEFLRDLQRKSGQSVVDSTHRRHGSMRGSVDRPSSRREEVERRSDRRPLSRSPDRGGRERRTPERYGSPHRRRSPSPDHRRSPNRQRSPNWQRSLNRQRSPERRSHNTDKSSNQRDEERRRAGRLAREQSWERDQYSNDVAKRATAEMMVTGSTDTASVEAIRRYLDASLRSV